MPLAIFWPPDASPVRSVQQRTCWYRRYNTVRESGKDAPYAGLVRVGGYFQAILTGAKTDGALHVNKQCDRYVSFRWWRLVLLFIAGQLQVTEALRPTGQRAALLTQPVKDF